MAGKDKYSDDKIKAASHELGQIRAYYEKLNKAGPSEVVVANLGDVLNVSAPNTYLAVSADDIRKGNANIGVTNANRITERDEPSIDLRGNGIDVVRYEGKKFHVELGAEKSEQIMALVKKVRGDIKSNADPRADMAELGQLTQAIAKDVSQHNEPYKGK